MAANVGTAITNPSTGTSHRFEHSFTELYDWDLARYQTDYMLYQWHTPRTLVEYHMCALSVAIRDKQDWYLKFRDDAIRNKWTAEIQDQQQSLHPSLQLTDTMVYGS